MDIVSYTKVVEITMYPWLDYVLYSLFFLIGIHPKQAEHPLQGMELQEKKHKKDYRIQKICLERAYS